MEIIWWIWIPNLSNVWYWKWHIEKLAGNVTSLCHQTPCLQVHKTTGSLFPFFSNLLYHLFYIARKMLFRTTNSPSGYPSKYKSDFLALVPSHLQSQFSDGLLCSLSLSFCLFTALQMDQAQHAQGLCTCSPWIVIGLLCKDCRAHYSHFGDIST